MAPQPILMLGAFLISPEAYGPMLRRLEQLSGQPVRLVPVAKPEWLLTVFAFGWARILDRVAVAASCCACFWMGSRFRHAATTARSWPTAW